MPPCRAVGASVRPFKIYRELEVLRNRGDHCLTVVPAEVAFKVFVIFGSRNSDVIKWNAKGFFHDVDF